MAAQKGTQQHQHDAVVVLQKPIHPQQKTEMVLAFYHYLLYQKRHIPSRADMLEDREVLDRLSAKILGLSDRNTFHILGATNAQTGVKEVYTITFDGEDEQGDGKGGCKGNGKENGDFMDTHTASAKLIRAVVEAEVTQAPVPRLMLVVEHKETDVVDENLSLLRHNPMNKSTITSRVNLHVTTAGAAAAKAASSQENSVYSSGQLFLCTTPFIQSK